MQKGALLFFFIIYLTLIFHIICTYCTKRCNYSEWFDQDEKNIKETDEHDLTFHFSSMAKKTLLITV